MKKVILIFLYISFTHPVFSQWLVGPTLAGTWTNSSISTATSSVVWLAGSAVTPQINRTTNGGLNWTSIPINGLPTMNLFCICGIDASTCYVGNGTGNASVFKTTNGGINWISLFSTGGDSTGFFNGIEFSQANPNIGIAQGDPPNGAGNNFYLQITTNGGANWNLLNPQPPPCGSYVASQHSPFIIDNNFFGFAMNGGGMCEITSNGGASWVSSYVGRNGFVSGLSFSSNKLNGIAAVSSSGLSTTSDGGLNWSTINVTGIEGAFLSFCYWVPSTNSIYASSSTGGIKKSTNSGQVWTSMTTGGHTDIRHMDFIRSGGTIYGNAICGNGVTLSLIDTQFFTPVHINYFNYYVDENIINLYWQTSYEINNSGFEIERSSQKQGWEKIGFVHGYGNKSSASSYLFSDKSFSMESYSYRLKQIDYNGNYEYFELGSDVIIGVPGKFKISQNYPNPFNPVTYINFNIPFDDRVCLKIYDVIGAEVAIPLNEDLAAGYYKILFDASKLPSGIYFYRLTSGKFSETKKLIVIK